MTWWMKGDSKMLSRQPARRQRYGATYRSATSWSC